MKDAQQFVRLSKQAPYSSKLGRLEEWNDTVDRYISEVLYDQYFLTSNPLDMTLVYNQDVVPSMRALYSAGKSLSLDSTFAYNCAYTEASSAQNIAEILANLMAGTGQGFSVERRCVSDIPRIKDEIKQGGVKDAIIVGDSREGWFKAFKEYMTLLIEQGISPVVDFSLIRKKGAPLKTLGGQASGPEPLIQLFSYVEKLVMDNLGNKLRPIDIHDLICNIADIVVVGGVRRSALISLFDMDDEEMLRAKQGEWWKTHPFRANANNSLVYDPEHSGSIDQWEFLDLFKAIHDSGSGEPGFFNRDAARRKAEKVGRFIKFPGVNPCGEIILRPKQFCNLTEAKAGTIEETKERLDLAARLGTHQSAMTNFPLLSPEWEANTKMDRLLGVSITGIYDVNGQDWSEEVLEEMRAVVHDANLDEAQKIGVEPSTSMTCIKPSGTVSQLIDCSSGLHPRHSALYIRRFRLNPDEPMCRFLEDQGMSSEVDRGQKVFSFVLKSPAGATTRKGVTAKDHFATYLKFAKHYTDHNPSITISVRPDEWIPLAQEVWNNIDDVIGISLLPYSDHTYAHAPFEEIAENGVIDWSKINDYIGEKDTKSGQEFACTAGGCEG